MEGGKKADLGDYLKIPDHIRRALDIEPGQEIDLIEYQGIVRMIPVTPTECARGFLKDVATYIEREPDRLR